MGRESDLARSEPIIRALIEGGGTFTLRPQGNSMRPTIVPGRDAVSIVKLNGRAKKHDILFYKRPDGQFVLHRGVKVRPADYVLCGDHQPVTEKGVRDEWIIGVVERIVLPTETLTRGSRVFLSHGRRRAMSRPFRYLYYRTALLYHRLRGDKEKGR